MENSSALAQSKPDVNTGTSAIVSSLAITLLVKQYGISLGKEYTRLLLKCLALEGDPSCNRCTAYEVVLQEYNDELRV